MEESSLTKPSSNGRGLFLVLAFILIFVLQAISVLVLVTSRTQVQALSATVDQQKAEMAAELARQRTTIDQVQKDVMASLHNLSVGADVEELRSHIRSLKQLADDIPQQSNPTTGSAQAQNIPVSLAAHPQFEAIEARLDHLSKQNRNATI